MTQANDATAPKPISIPYTFDSQSPPIQYFKLDKSHFDGELWNPTNGKTTVSIKDDIQLKPDEYLSMDTNLAGLNLYDKNTTVLNFQVGKGKTQLQHKCMLKYLAQPDKYVIFYVAPFKRLLEQNKKEIEDLAREEGVPVQIWNCTSEQKTPKNGISDDGLGSNIYLMTPEFLMGSGGKSYQPQSQRRTVFKKDLLKCIGEEGKKIILFLDECHENVKMYATIRFAHLYTLEPKLISKIFVASATFTREAIEVVKAVAMLTQRKITVYQGDRVKTPKQAKLHLHICRDKYKPNDLGSIEKGLEKVLQESIDKNHQVHILTAHKEMAKAINEAGGDLGKVIDELKPQRLIGDDDAVFDETTHSIGTTFTTGINITNAASTLILILPGKIPLRREKSYSNFNAYGIFTGGHIALVQSLARLRNGGEIHVFMRSFDTYIHSEQLRENNRADCLIRKAHIPTQVPATSEEELFMRFKGVHGDEVNKYNLFVKSILDSKASPYEAHRAYFGEPPKLYDFILSHYADYRMANSYAEGKHLSPLVLWLALNHQLANCTLKTATIYLDKASTTNAQTSRKPNKWNEVLSEAGLGDCLSFTPTKRLPVLLELLANQTQPLPPELEPFKALSNIWINCRDELTSKAIHTSQGSYIEPRLRSTLTPESWQMIIEAFKAVQGHKLTKDGILSLPNEHTTDANIDAWVEKLIRTGYADKPYKMEGRGFKKGGKYRKLLTASASKVN